MHNHPGFDMGYLDFVDIIDNGNLEVRLVSRYWAGMLEKSWPEISKGLGKELEVFSASDVPDSVKLH